MASSLPACGLIWGDERDDVSCDLSLGELDFSPASQLAGRWCSDENAELQHDEEARLRFITRPYAYAGPYEELDQTFGCEPGQWPLVLDDPTVQGGVPRGGQFGPTGNGTRRVLEDHLITPNTVYLQYMFDGPEHNGAEILVVLIEMDPITDELTYFSDRYPVGDESFTIDRARESPNYDFLISLYPCP